MNSIIPDKLKEELEDVGKVYNSRSGMCVYPNAFSRLQTEIIKVCNKNKDLEAQIEKMKCCGNCENGELSAHEEPCQHCQRCFASKDVTDHENVKDNWEWIKEMKEDGKV